MNQRPHRHRAFASLLALFICAIPTAHLAGQKRTTDRVLEVDKVKRDYVLHVPRSYKKSQKKQVALVIMLHGRTSNGRRAASSYYGWTRLADRAGFIAAFPTALGKPTSWKAAWSGRPTADSEFLAQLIDALLKEFRIDKHRVFMTGHSSGGFMSFSFAKTHPDKVAAIAPVAGLAIGGGRKPKMPVSVISFHGMKDTVVAYDSVKGKSARWGRGMTSAPDSAAMFARSNGCAKKPVRKELMKGRVLLDTWTGGKNGTRVEFYSLVEGGHGWPQASRKSVAATPLIWKFFAEHGRANPAAKNKQSKKKRTTRK